METGENDALTENLRVVKANVLRSVSGSVSYEADQLSIEEPLEIALLSGEETISMGVAFRTPGDDEALALGMLRNEGVIRSMDDVISIRAKREVHATMPAARIAVRVAKHVQIDKDRYSRAFPISAACGACGKSALGSLRIDREAPFPDGGIAMSYDMLSSLPDKLLAAQPDFRRTGSIHAAARFDAQGELLALSEDIGRHNAMDKLVGSHLQLGGPDWSEQAILFSGRLGYDLMQKAIAVGCPLVASIGAPSSFAVELATLFNVTLVGFLRGERFNVYSAPHRVLFPS